MIGDTVTLVQLAYSEKVYNLNALLLRIHPQGSREKCSIIQLLQ